MGCFLIVIWLFFFQWVPGWIEFLLVLVCAHLVEVAINQLAPRKPRRPKCDHCYHSAPKCAECRAKEEK